MADLDKIAGQVAEVAQLTEALPALPNGFDTMLGERGINLSGVPPVLLTQTPKPLLLRRTQVSASPGQGTMTPTPLSVPQGPAAHLAATLEPLLGIPKPGGEPARWRE